MTPEALKALFLERLLNVGQEAAGSAMERHRSLVSKFVGGECGLKLDQLAALIDVLGLEISDAGKIGLDADEYEQLLQMQADLATLKLKLLRERK